MKKLLLTSLAVPAMMLGLSANASAQEVDFSASVDVVSEYVFRGVTLAGVAVQPGVEAAYGNFTAGAWLSAPLEDGSNWDTELDLYAGYSFTLSEDTSFDVGATLYHYPEGDGGLLDIGVDTGDASTLEFYGSLGFGGVMFEPSLTAYYDISFEALTLEASAGHSIPLSETTSIDLGLTLGVVSVDGPGDYEYGSLSAAYTLAMSDSSSFYFGANLGVSSDKTFTRLSDYTGKAQSAWAGAGFSTSF